MDLHVFGAASYPLCKGNYMILVSTIRDTPAGEQYFTRFAAEMPSLTFLNDPVLIAGGDGNCFFGNQ